MELQPRQREALQEFRRRQPLAGKGEPGRVLAADAQGIVVACGEGALRLVELQKPGGKRLAAAEFLKGFPLAGLKLH